jgi:hypothetical protein
MPRKPDAGGPERLSLRWAFILVISLLAGMAVSTAGPPALAIGTVVAVAYGLHQILR